MKILLADDDPEIAALVRQNLQELGWAVDVVDDGRDAVHALLAYTYDVAILDRQMPGLDGLSVLKSIRAARIQTPIIFLSVMNEVADRVDGLKAGADDYLSKPFHFSELQARIENLTKRIRSASADQATMLVVHDLSLDLLSRTARRKDHSIALKAKEYAILEILMRNAGRIVTKSMLLERVWDFTFDPNTSVVETHVSRLRAKIDRPFDVHLIHTIRNAGYMLNGPD